MSAYEDEVVTLATGVGTGIEVAGEGALADRLRDRLAGASPAAGAQPEVVVLASSGLDEVLSRVADLGTVIVAGSPEPATISVDLYVDLHSRGITLIGMPGPQDAS